MNRPARAPEVVMATGPRELRHPAGVRAGFAAAAAGFELAVTGGAEGGDTQAAWGADDARVPFEVWLPNRFYRRRYPRSIPDGLLARAVAVRYIVDRDPLPGEDPMRTWARYKWWVDNFARNEAMAAAAGTAVVVHPMHPRQLLAAGAGGTAHCVRALIAAGHTGCLWVPDDGSGRFEEVELVDPPAPTLFDLPAVLSHRPEVSAHTKTESDRPAVIWQGDLRKVYLDPLVGPRDILCWIPEQHASPRCERAIKGGTRDTKPDPTGPWCEMCVTPDRAHATKRRTLTGWKAA